MDNKVLSINVVIIVLMPALYRFVYGSQVEDVVPIVQMIYN